MGKNVEVR